MNPQLIASFLLAFVVSLLLTLLVERQAPRFGLVAHPKHDRWHRKAVPIIGGAAFAIATIVPSVLSVADRRLAIFAMACVIMAVVGMIDDVRELSPQVKLLAQVLLAAALVQAGFVLRLTGYPLADFFVTMFWLVGITNAFNLLDNMDGLAATIAMVAAAFRLTFLLWEGELDGARICLFFMGALAGFLVRNFPPATVFMGDTGSLFLGFFLAGFSLYYADRPYSRGVAAVLVIPVLLLLIPIFDTAFVTATRLLSGRSIAVGGRDHTSHRLVAIGLKEWQVVVLLAALSAAAGGLAILSYEAGLSQTVVLLALLVIVFVLLGIHLSRVRVVHSVEERDAGTVLRLLANFQYKRQVLTLTLDVGLIVIAYYASYLLRFEHAFPAYRDQLFASLPVVLVVQLAALSAFGLYRGVWQYTGLSDVIGVVKAVTVGTMVAVVALLYISRFEGYSRSVFILDWLLLIALITASRVSFRVFGETLRAQPETFRRVLIYGAGDGGALVVREILNNGRLQRLPVGFLDDDRSKHQTRIHGVPVLGGMEDVEALVRAHRASEIIVSSGKIGESTVEQIHDACRDLEVTVRRASLRLD